MKDPENVQPKFYRAWPVPYAMKEKIEYELERLLKLGVIAPVDYSDWATPVVPILKKDGSIRLCGNFKITINPFLEQDEYPLPIAQELFDKLGGGQEFSKIDLSNAHFQLVLDDESTKLVVISTHKGLFKYLRLPFGVSPASKIFQKKLNHYYLILKVSWYYKMILQLQAGIEKNI